MYFKLTLYFWHFVHIKKSKRSKQITLQTVQLAFILRTNFYKEKIIPTRNAILTEQLDSSFRSSQLVSCLADVLTVLSLLNCDHSQSCVRKFVCNSEMWNPVMLIIGKGDLILLPWNGWWWVGFNVTFQIHIELEGLTKSWSWYDDHGREFNFHSNVTWRQNIFIVVCLE